jgi:hypothetical protein
VFYAVIFKGIVVGCSTKKRIEGIGAKSTNKKKIREETHQHTTRNPPFFKSFLKTNLNFEKKRNVEP